MRYVRFSLVLVMCAALVGCGDDDGRGTTVSSALACDSEPVIMTTDAGVEFVRTPDSCFDAIPNWSYEAQYVEIDGLRQAYVDAGPANGPVVLLLHGQPSWAYLYRKMIPVLADAGYRVIAMDHLGMGRSDKPIDIAAYSFLGHYERFERFVDALGLEDINLFVQDWGSLIGLRYAGLNPDRFARIAVGDGMLPVIPEGIQPFPAVENPDEIADIPSGFAQIPAQQTPFYDDCDLLLPAGGADFGSWIVYAMTAASFRPSEVIEALTWFDLPTDEEAAYDAPFPSRIYMAGPRTFPSLVNDLPGLNDEAWAGLTSFERPFLTLWAANDPGNLGQCETQAQLVSAVPGAWGQPHDRLAEASHFLQDDQGAEIAQRLVEFYASEPIDLPQPLSRGSRYCEMIVVRMVEGAVEADVWGTQSLNDCPAESWEALDEEIIRAETGALAVVLNGPRNWLPNSTTSTLPADQRQTFGDLEMRFLATLEVDPNAGDTPYTERTVRRTTTFVFDQGEEIYELTSPEGVVYVMQSVSQIVDPTLTLADLPTLSERLGLPAGWSYQARTLDSDLVLVADGTATILQDDLLNTYQRATVGMPTDPDPTLPVLGNGTGTLCRTDADCQGLEAAHCLIEGSTGFCTVEGCAVEDCGAPYVCCSGCNPIAAPFLPFEDSACLPGALTQQLTAQAGCTCDGDDSTVTAPLELTQDLCSDPSNMAALLDSPTGSNLLSLGDQVNQEQVQRMIDAPTAGPFYMFNLIRYRERAEYFDGRDTDLSGREADALYAPVEFISAIGARLVFVSEVDQQIDGDDIIWETVAIVEYPCPVAFFAMISHPEFQARAIHKDAGVEETIVMVTELAPSQLPEGFVPPESPYPATEEDPAFELIHVMDFHEIAQYEDGVDEPVRTGAEAWQIYAANGSEAAQHVGSYPTARFVVQGVFLGDERSWDEVQIVHMPSRAAFQALLDDDTRQAGRYHRYAALDHNYSLITSPALVDIPSAPPSGEPGPLPVTDDGTGTLCSTDADCLGLDAAHCLSEGSTGFCTTEGCVAEGCGAPYVCCSDCLAAAAPFLPFDGSACLPEAFTRQLTEQAGCTCEGAMTDVDPSVDPSPRVGFEILEVQSPTSILAWISTDITREEFDALELPAGWIKNQPREGDPDAGRFHRSPGAALDGEFRDEELFGFIWRHSATVTQTGVPLDEQGLLIGATVTKFHELTFDAGRTMFVLFSPQGEAYFRIGRDANRMSDDPTIPDSWRLVEHTTPERLVIQLPDETLVIRTDNQDSFQGPVPELAVAF